MSDDPSLQLAFSCDTLSFDTVFTEQGSATAQIKVYNPNANAVEIDRVWQTDGTSFHVNVDGEADLSRLNRLIINGGDSLFVFVRVDINPLNSNNPLLVNDQLFFHLANGKIQQVELEAYGQNVNRLRPKNGKLFVGHYTFSDTLPYLIYDTLVVDSSLIFRAGSRVYMHRNACIYAQGDVQAQGTIDAPVIVCGDRLDRLFDSVPYAYAGGSWNGIYLVSDQPRTYDLQYMDILSGNVGICCVSTCTDPLPQLTMNGCRIHNHTQYGLVLSHVDAVVSNTEISNCALNCVYCSGGQHQFVHTTVASYFGYTNIRIQSVVKGDNAAVYIDNLNKTAPQTIASFYNSIITGYLTNQVVVATPFDHYYPGYFVGNYLKTDTLRMPHAAGNIYWQTTDTAKVFVNDFYKYKEYIYYDFHLDSISPAIGIGDSLAAIPYPKDRDGVSRAFMRPDAGCYQHRP